MLDNYCGHHCGTKDGLTRHCRCCHAWGLYEADGCGQGVDEYGARFLDYAETHDPGSHELDDLADAEKSRYDALTMGE